MEMSRTTSSPLLARAKIEDPARQIPVHISRTTVDHKYINQGLSGMMLDQFPVSEPKFNFIQSIRPTAFIPVLKANPR